MDLVVVLLIGLAVGAGAGFVVGRSRSGGISGLENVDVLTARHATEVAELRHAEAQERALLQADLAQAQATAVALREQVAQLSDQQRREIAEREKSKADESKVLQQMAPIAEQLKAMHQKVDVIEKQRHEQHGKLEEQIKATRETAEKSKAAAEMLNAALRNNQQRGAYGELQLESIVEAAGLIKRVDFNTQESITVDDAARRPDMVVKLPGGKEMAVDAKVPYAAFIEAHRGDIDDPTRAAHFKEHAKQVKAHVNTLSARGYFGGLRTSPEYTVAFIPSEAILNAALDAEPTLMTYAFSKGVVLATPVSLFAVLKTVAFTWKQEDLAENARELVAMGKTMYTRLATMTEHVAKLGRSIEGSVKDYNKFVGSLESSVLPHLRKFDQVDLAKELPATKHIEEAPRGQASQEFAALEQLDGVERPELDTFEPTPDELGDQQTA
jgi:DNA recombination protein RmuC